MDTAGKGRCVVGQLTPLAAIRAGLVALAVGTGAVPVAGQDGLSPRTSGTERMVERLAAIAQESALTNPYASSLRAQAAGAVTPPTELQDLLRYRGQIARFLLYAGQSQEAAAASEGILQEALAQPTSVSPTFMSAMRQLLALAYLRVATQQNCVLDRATPRCSLPIRRDGIHANDRSARRAIEEYTHILGNPPDESTALTSQWLLNLAYMTVGEYPFGVPEQWLIPPEAFRSEYDIKRFPDVASRLGLDVAGRKGGTVMDDFDGDGDLDIMASSAGLFAVAAGENRNQLRYFRNLVIAFAQPGTIYCGDDSGGEGLSVSPAGIPGVFPDRGRLQAIPHRPALAEGIRLPNVR